MADARNLVLTGFMGTGKTCVGQSVAQSLRRPFVDMDAMIAGRAGMSIPDIFQRAGEEVFRQYERALCEELAAQNGLVIATGGGALVDSRNRQVMARNGCLICLDCEEDELWVRLRGDNGRPMLWGGKPEQRLRELLRARRPAYIEIPHHVDTTSLTIARAAEQVLDLFTSQPTAWHVKTPNGSYQVHLVSGGLAYLGALLRARAISSNVVVVSDAHVGPLYGERVLASLRQSGFTPAEIVLPAGEEHKTLESVALLYDRFATAGLDRSAAVIALGGGVITDMVGFAATTFMRGVPLVQVPTTLLGMVDASIGGKVAVDHPRGKNLVGAFVHPLLVMLDPRTLDSLPDIERRAGLAEVIKAGVIADPELFAALESSPLPASGQELGAEGRWLVERAIQAKIAVVEEDPYEQGRRAVLNLGHTFAHAFEVLADYRLHHGLAVSVGMAAAAYLAAARGLCAAETCTRIISTLERHRLPVTYDAQSPGKVYQAMWTDKKRQGARLRFVLPRAIGDVVIVNDVTEQEVIAALERTRA